MYQASMIVTQTFLPMPVYTIVALIYFLMVMAITWLMRLATRRLPNFHGYFPCASGSRRVANRISQVIAMTIRK